MSKYVLLDANLLIGAFDHDATNSKHIESKQIVEDLLLDDKVKIAITPLIRYEVLRGVRRVPTEQMVEILNDFEEFEITDVEGNRASDIYRLALVKQQKLDKRSFDVFHYVVAEIRDLEWMSQDNDLSKIAILAKPIIEGHI
ncbi:PIN domain-containing protein [Psychrobacter submarinus]|uniref:PIN domain-containing protein n=1 Tax=Psychrobacter TaxID=497 RepID=UPI001917E445|nr:PIN domain-containing protein [Psychrobacter submarinus]MCG3882052.1 PIN domain-containing protein [Psychrobacter sp. Ps3]